MILNKQKLWHFDIELAILLMAYVHAIKYTLKNTNCWSASKQGQLLLFNLKPN